MQVSFVPDTCFSSRGVRFFAFSGNHGLDFRETSLCGNSIITLSYQVKRVPGENFLLNVVKRVPGLLGVLFKPCPLQNLKEGTGATTEPVDYGLSPHQRNITRRPGTSMCLNQAAGKSNEDDNGKLHQAAGKSN